MKTIINSQQSLEDYISKLRADFEEFRYLEAEHKNKGKARSLQQNNALHLYSRNMANLLNDRGVPYVDWLNHKASRGIETPWSEEKFKDAFKDYAGVMFPECIDEKGEARTSRLNRKQISAVYELVNERMSSLFGAGTVWPSEE